MTATKTNTCNISHCGCNEPPWYDGSTYKAGDDNTGKSRKKQMDLFFLRSPCTTFHKIGGGSEEKNKWICFFFARLALSLHTEKQLTKISLWQRLNVLASLPREATLLV